MEVIDIVYLILSLIFLIICAFFASAEIGFINLQRIKLRRLQEEGVRGSDRVARILEKPEQFLSTVLTGISFAETVFVYVGTLFIVSLLPDKVGPPIAIILVAILLLLFAKVIPKSYAARHPARIALLYGGPIEIVARIFRPIIITLDWMISKIMGTSHMTDALISKEEIHTVISAGEEGGVVDEESAQMLRKVVGLGDRQVSEIMTPRTGTTWLELGNTLNDFFAVYKENPATRYPIYETNYDNVKGMLSTRDVLLALSQGSIHGDSIVTDMARPVYFVPGTKTVGELFSEMRAEGYLLSIVVDEYGGSSGIVSIDQLIEEIVGEVKEEIVGARTEYKVVGERTFRIQGSMKIEEANVKLGLDLPEGDYKTIGGFALNLFGHLPSEGEQIVYENLRLVVAQIKDNKIARLFVTKEKDITEELQRDIQALFTKEEAESD